MIEEINTKCLHIISREKAKELGMKKYFSGETCKKGHVNERLVSQGKCVVCLSEARARYREKYPEKLVSDMTEEEREEKRARGQANYHENKGVIGKLNRRYRNRDSEQIKERRRKSYQEKKDTAEYKKSRRDSRARHAEANKKRSNDWYYNNKERAMARGAEYEKRRRQEDPTYRMRGAARNMIVRLMRITGEDKTKRTHELLGYSPDDLRKHLESRFVDGMSWDNWGEIHIDHLYPVSKFIDSGITDHAIINALDNLIPMWWRDNLDKKDMTMEEWLEQKGEDSREWKLYSRYL